jgi:hypothetical protein
VNIIIEGDAAKVSFQRLVSNILPRICVYLMHDPPALRNLTLIMIKATSVIAIFIAFVAQSCQKRTVCKAKTSNGGSSYVRLYESAYSSPASYQDAIAQLKSEGYVCDDSTVAFVK